MWVPYTCYYHLYSRDDVYRCAETDKLDWILAMGDSQEREFVAHFKMMNGTVKETTKFERADFVMHQSPNKLRITWQFFMTAFFYTDAFLKPRDFAGMDQVYFDHFNIRPTAVRASRVLWDF